MGGVDLDGVGGGYGVFFGVLLVLVRIEWVRVSVCELFLLVKMLFGSMVMVVWVLLLMVLWWLFRWGLIRIRL